MTPTIAQILVNSETTPKNMVKFYAINPQEMTYYKHKTKYNKIVCIFTDN